MPTCLIFFRRKSGKNAKPLPEVHLNSVPENPLPGSHLKEFHPMKNKMLVMINATTKPCILKMSC